MRFIRLVLLIIFIFLSSCVFQRAKYQGSFEATERMIEMSPSSPTLMILSLTVSPTITTSSTPTVTPTSAPTPTSTPIVSVWNIVAPSADSNQAYVMFVDQSGNLWFGGPDNLVIWDMKNGSYTVYRAGSEVNKSFVLAIAQTQDQTVWIGSFGFGVTSIDSSNHWKTYTKKDGLPSNYVGNLVTSTDGSLWLDTSSYAHDLPPLTGGFIGRFDGEQWGNFQPAGFYQLAAGQDNSIWGNYFPPDPNLSGSIERFNGEKWEVIKYPGQPARIYGLTVAPSGEVWAATENSILVYDGQSWRTLRPPWIGKTKSHLSAIEVTQDGTAWFGFSYAYGFFGFPCGVYHGDENEFGVYRYDGNNWTHFTKEDGLIDNKICDITSGPDGSVWFGSYDQGVSRFDGENWTSFTIR